MSSSALSFMDWRTMHNLKNHTQGMRWSPWEPDFPRKHSLKELYCKMWSREPECGRHVVQEWREPAQRRTMQVASNCFFVLKGPPEELSKMHLRTDSQEIKRENYTPLVNVVLMGHKHHQWRKCKNVTLVSTTKSQGGSKRSFATWVTSLVTEAAAAVRKLRGQEHLK